MPGRELHAPSAEIVHRRNTNIMSEAIGKDRSREADFASKFSECPRLCRLPMDEPQSVSNVAML